MANEKVIKHMAENRQMQDDVGNLHSIYALLRKGAFSLSGMQKTGPPSL